MSNSELLETIQSVHFTLYDCILYLTKYADQLGVHHYICTRMLQFSHTEIQFYIPQLVQIILTVQTESMALEDLVIQLSHENPHFALLTFWQLQGQLADLSSDPMCYGFQIARRLLNNLQYVLFSVGHPPEEHIKENVAPAIVLAGLLPVPIAVAEYMKPVVLSQGKKQKSHVFKLAKNAMASLTRNLTLKNSKSYDVEEPNDTSYRKSREESPKGLSVDMIDDIGDQIFETRMKKSSRRHSIYNGVASDGDLTATPSPPQWRNSMPDLHTQDHIEQPSSQQSVSTMSVPTKIKTLRSNYFRCETQFAVSLETISGKLSQLPPDARLSALRAELSVLNRDLPAQVDIPTLLPPNKKGKLHQLVKISANEAIVLNSAEKVPYLMYLEYLSDEMDFDPNTEVNEAILRRKNSGYIFDLTSQQKNEQPVPVSKSRGSVTEMDLGDVSITKLSNQMRNELLVSNVQNIPVIEKMRDASLGFDENSTGDKVDDLATQMRIAAVMLSQLEASSQTDQSNEIRAKIISSMQEVEDSFIDNLDDLDIDAGERKLENDINTSYLGEDWASRRERIRKTSEYGNRPNWDLCSVIAKTGDDLRQEAFACQLIQTMSTIWYTENVNVWVKKMKILITSANTGLVETITNAISVHSIKKSLTKKLIEEGQQGKQAKIATIQDHFKRSFPEGAKYERAQHNFAKSLAAYSVIGYLLQIKDRHNGNIMLDNEGHICHIDFGFMLSNSPGAVGFEAAPFKLTWEYIEVMGGLDSPVYREFVSLMQQAFKALRKNAEQIISMCEIMQVDSSQPCFNAGLQTSIALRQRFHLGLEESEVDNFVEEYLIGKSIGSVYTRLYDQFQLITQGIYN